LLHGRLLSSQTFKQSFRSSVAAARPELNYASYLLDGFTIASVLSIPCEDSFVCIPIAYFGISILNSVVGGIVFGLMHLARYTFIECIGKSIYYSLICLLVLPHGLLTVFAGHFLIDGVSLLGLLITKHHLTEKN
jgi:hypothetical protein